MNIIIAKRLGILPGELPGKPKKKKLKKGGKK